ncbi:GH10906 [Drosophila grimshawi]|uniref:Glycosyltransferase family 92 protein n=1 Tax=Drosophila grimshawi TaxID=7222 RepID=B4JAV6_DROGR|nr:GH10906 [Drosophila grimshawi]
MPSFPLEELLRRNCSTEPNCGKVPKFLAIDFSNDYWQTVHIENLTYHLFGAYYDNREKITEAPLVRVLSMINNYGARDKVKYPDSYCQMWFKNRVDPVIANVSDHKIIWRFGGSEERHVFPTLISCPLPKTEKEVPEMVSVVAQRCDKARNLLRVIYEPDVKTVAMPQQKDQAMKDQDNSRKPLRFMVCVKGLDFPYKDMSWRLIEWLELMRLMGVSKVVFYDGQIHPNMTRVINDYVTSSPGFVELRPLSMGRGEPHTGRNFHHYAMAADDFNRILNEMIPYNDCFYRNMYKFDYVGVFDIDEVIMPLGNITKFSNLIELAHKVPDYERNATNCTTWASFCFRNVYFPLYPERPKIYRNLPSFYYMLQHVERVVEPCNRFSATKCFHSTQFVVGLHNHLPFFRAQNGECDPKSVPIEFAQLHHYREPDNKTRLLNPVVDDNIWRFQPQLQQRVYSKYEKLGFLPDIQQWIDAENRRRKDDEQQLHEAIFKT